MSSKKVLTTFNQTSLKLIDEYQLAYKQLKGRKISRDDVVNMFLSDNKSNIEKSISKLKELKIKSENA